MNRPPPDIKLYNIYYETKVIPVIKACIGLQSRCGNTLAKALGVGFQHQRSILTSLNEGNPDTQLFQQDDQLKQVFEPIHHAISHLTNLGSTRGSFISNVNYNLGLAGKETLLSLLWIEGLFTTKPSHDLTRAVEYIIEQIVAVCYRLTEIPRLYAYWGVSTMSTGLSQIAELTERLSSALMDSLVGLHSFVSDYAKLHHIPLSRPFHPESKHVHSHDSKSINHSQNHSNLLRSRQISASISNTKWSLYWNSSNNPTLVCHTSKDADMNLYANWFLNLQNYLKLFLPPKSDSKIFENKNSSNDDDNGNYFSNDTRQEYGLTCEQCGYSKCLTESDLQDHVMNICTETLVQSSYYTSVDMYQATPPAVYNNPNNPNNPDSMHINASCPDHNNPSNPSSPSSPSNPYQAEWFPRKELHNRLVADRALLVRESYWRKKRLKLESSVLSPIPLTICPKCQRRSFSDPSLHPFSYDDYLDHSGPKCWCKIENKNSDYQSMYNYVHDNNVSLSYADLLTLPFKTSVIPYIPPACLKLSPSKNPYKMAFFGAKKEDFENTLFERMIYRLVRKYRACVISGRVDHLDSPANPNNPNNPNSPEKSLELERKVRRVYEYYSNPDNPDNPSDCDNPNGEVESLDHLVYTGRIEIVTYERILKLMGVWEVEYLFPVSEVSTPLKALKVGYQGYHKCEYHMIRAIKVIRIALKSLCDYISYSPWPEQTASLPEGSENTVTTQHQEALLTPAGKTSRSGVTNDSGTPNSLKVLQSSSRGLSSSTLRTGKYGTGIHMFPRELTGMIILYMCDFSGWTWSKSMQF